MGRRNGSRITSTTPSPAPWDLRKPFGRNAFYCPAPASAHPYFADYAAPAIAAFHFAFRSGISEAGPLNSRAVRIVARASSAARCVTTPRLNWRAPEAVRDSWRASGSTDGSLHRRGHSASGRPLTRRLWEPACGAAHAGASSVFDIRRDTGKRKRRRQVQCDGRFPEA
jgi:hypothetical protein